MIHITQDALMSCWSAARLNKKTITVNTLTVMLVLAAFFQLIPLPVYAADVKITSISSTSGKVEDPITLTGTINTTNGEYMILFGNLTVASGFASGNIVTCTFSVPPLPRGNYTIMLRDVNASIDSEPLTFQIETNYIVKVEKPQPPYQFQEGTTTINITVNVTGGIGETTYTANVTVRTPANETFWKLTYVNTTNIGMGNTSLRYPEDFGVNAHTNYTGIYTVYFNGTLASDMFFIGLTDRTEYHRGDTVRIKAVGYSSLNGENVTITVKLGAETIARFNHTVLGDIVEANWAVPNNASIGNYSLSIIPTPATKKVDDAQVFAVPGFEVRIVSQSLAYEAVSNVTIKVHDFEAGKTYNIVSGVGGVASIRLEKGAHKFTAYFKKVRVGEVSVNITGELMLNLTCQITNLKITVENEQNPEVKIPFVSLNLTATYTTELDGVRIENEIDVTQTDIEGSARFVLPILNATYRLTASRYGRTFFNGTIPELKPEAWNNVKISCPVKSLTVNVTDANNSPIPGALVEIQDVMGGLYDAKFTNSNGQVSFNCVFGIYNIKVSSRNAILNQTTTEIFDEKTVTVRCLLYNLPIYVRVVDYFGQPISNVNVTLERGGVQLGFKLTNANGLASFIEIGGTLTIKVYLAGQSQPELSVTYSVMEARSEANPIEVKLSRYVALAGILVETAWFATIILIVAAIAIFTALEVARRRFK